MTSLVTRVALAPTWFDAFRIVATPLFDRAAAELAIKQSDLPTLIVNPPADWAERRAPCRRYAFDFADRDDWPTAGAWAMLAVDPSVLPSARAEEEGLLYSLALFGIASAIAQQRDLAADEPFAQTVFGWRFLDRHGCLASATEQPDPIVAAQRIGAPLAIDRDDTLTWARAWAEARS